MLKNFKNKINLFLIKLIPVVRISIRVALYTAYILKCILYGIVILALYYTLLCFVDALSWGYLWKGYLFSRPEKPLNNFEINTSKDLITTIPVVKDHPLKWWLIVGAHTTIVLGALSWCLYIFFRD